MMKLAGSLAPLQRLTRLFNMETNLSSLKTANRSRREQTKLERKDVFDKHQGVAWRPDLIPIKLVDMSFSYGEEILLHRINATQAQGSVVAIVGEHGSGKTTLMKLLGHTLFPDQGMVFIPSHLRPLFISQEIMILKFSAWENVTFGNPDSSPARVKAILNALDMQNTLKVIRADLKRMGREAELEDGAGEDDEDHELNREFVEEIDEGWHNMLPFGEKAKIHLVRGLVMNPEVLVAQRPVCHYDDDTSKQVMDVLMEYVANRGYKLPESSKHRRRPRTLFFSPSSNIELNRDDMETCIIWEMDRSTGGLRTTTRDKLSQTDIQRISTYN